MCCANGYFIDCFETFQANKNDAEILRYILQTDNDFEMKGFIIAKKIRYDTKNFTPHKVAKKIF